MPAVPPLHAIAALIGLDPDDPLDAEDFAALRDLMARREALAESRCGNDTYTYTVRHGEEQGVVLRPHLYSDGCFVVSMTRFARDQIKVPRHEPLRGWLQKGYSVRMSAPGVSPRLISPASVEGFDG